MSVQIRVQKNESFWETAYSAKSDGFRGIWPFWKRLTFQKSKNCANPSQMIKNHDQSPKQYDIRCSGGCRTHQKCKNRPKMDFQKIFKSQKITYKKKKTEVQKSAKKGLKKCWKVYDIWYIIYNKWYKIYNIIYIIYNRYNISLIYLFLGCLGGSKTPSSAIFGLFWVKWPFFWAIFAFPWPPLTPLSLFSTSNNLV